MCLWRLLEPTVFMSTDTSVTAYINVFVNRWTAGDTIYQDKVVWKYVYRDKVKYDTVAILRSDTINVPYPVECKLSKWEQLKLNVGGWAISIIIITLILLMGYMYKRKED